MRPLLWTLVRVHHEWIDIVPFALLTIKEMVHNGRVMVFLPVNPILTDVSFERIVCGWRDDIKATRSVLDHTKEEELGGTRRGLSADVQAVRIPRRSPFRSVLIDRVEEKVVDEPKVGRSIGIKAVAVLQLQEKALPLTAEARGNVVPQAFDAGVMNAPVGRLKVRVSTKDRLGTPRTSPRCTSRD